jgi:hypothetical protein
MLVLILLVVCRSIVNLLIARFQRKTFTPRNFVLARSPRYTPHASTAVAEAISDFSHPARGKVVSSCQLRPRDGWILKIVIFVISIQEDCFPEHPQRMTRKRQNAQSNIGEPSSEVVDAVVALILLVIESSPVEVSRIIAALQLDSLTNLNDTISEILSNKKL